MNSVVFIKWVPDNTRLKWQGDTPQCAQQSSDWMLNPLDEYALELALQLKASHGGSLTVISMGSHKDGLKKAVALGADTVCLIEEVSFFDAATRANALAKAAIELAPDATVWLCGQSALDTLAGVTGPLLAAQQHWPWLGRITAAEVDASGQLTVTSSQSQVSLSYVVTGPVVLSCIKGKSELRSPNIKGVMQANKAVIPTKTLAELGVPVAADAPNKAHMRARPAKAPGVLIHPSSAEDAAEQLVNFLQQQGIGH
jgi:electron transfer flavoprotein beta subunit